MSRMKKTPWFDGDVKPVKRRIGLYERKWEAGIVKNFWDGAVWRWLGSMNPCGWQSLPWRGLTKEVK